MHNDGGDQVAAVVVHLNTRPCGRDPTRGCHRVALVPASRHPGRFTCRIDATHLHRHGRNPGQTEHQDHHQGGDGQGRLNGARTRTAG